MRRVACIWLVMIALGFNSCEENPVGDCFKSTGRIVTEEREGGSFNFIYLNDNVNLILTQDTINSIAVEAGENLIDGVETSLHNNQLRILNHNSCKWVRSYEHEVNVHVHLKRLDSIEYRSSGDLTSTNALVNDSVLLNIRQGSGSINLKLNVAQSKLYEHYGTADLHISGKSTVTYIYAASYGPFYCSELDSKFTYINNKGTNDCYVRAEVELGASIEYLGNIYYYGNPESILKTISGEGKLIKLGD
ncbi:MAG: DUF2807 domain-containing protein [Bacteroidales bacterium]|nr:DUF2807 domain-containing protein [Bacteroidales bacterium]MCF8344686.1 DUF2807 domain-containing protein [Bacteroidales bacterium]MCF8350714.1 DUF2807 domain-containing protein [Bacteroidales bacterium]MCF8377525.1 DUF2807 domain-containing protein [Bacteroidales bacterium]MCF8401808.1 DUF2807 domain-containing protein [Bacteroidales bacterium]